jgi:hypothetical protein
MIEEIATPQEEIIIPKEEKPNLTSRFDESIKEGKTLKIVEFINLNAPYIKLTGEETPGELEELYIKILS